MIRHGRVIVERSYGAADLENHVPVTNDTEFSIASITKQLTAAAVLQLADRGALSLDDDISRFLPDFPAHDRGVTVRRLLNHTAGIHNVNSLPRYWEQSGQATTPEKLIALFRDLPLDFEPGTSYAYSNSGYILLGAVIEKATGTTYDEYVRKNLLAPLQLNRMVDAGTARLIEHRAHGYTFAEGSFANASHFHDSQAFAMGSMYSTAEALARWTDALHHGRVLPAAAYRQMIEPGVLPDGESLTYGYGMEVGRIGGFHFLGHAGGGVGFTSQTLFIPERDLTVSVLSNSSAGGASLEVADEIMRKILRIPEPANLPLPAAAAGRYVGVYEMDGDAVHVELEGGHIIIRYGDAEARRLRYQGGGVFAQDGRLARVQFVEVDGSVKGFKLTRYGSELGRAARVKTQQ